MSSADMALVARKLPPGWTNMAIGEPVFLQQALDAFYPDSVQVEHWHHKYPDPSGCPILKNELLSAPDLMLGGRLGFDPKNIVVTAGGKQALIAAMVGLRRTKNCGSVRAPNPYWLSLPTLASHAGLLWTPNDADINITTWPNNPNGLAAGKPAGTGTKVFNIWDAVYASPVYGFDPKFSSYRIKTDVLIGSFSKVYGLSGLRLGWAAFRDDSVAAAATEYIETTTSGVPGPAQAYASKFLRKKARHGTSFVVALSDAEATLETNASHFNLYMKPYACQVQGVPAGQGGMFAWFRAIEPARLRLAMQRAKVSVIDGTSFGGSVDQFRMSLGLPCDEFAAALGRIHKEMKA